MLSVETAWTPFDIELQFAGDAATFSWTDSVGSATGCMLALVAWANDAGRPWHGSVLFGWSWSRDPATGGAIVVLSANHAFDINISAGELYVPTGAAQTTYQGTAPAAGTWAPTVPIAVSRHARLLGEGDAGGATMIRPGCQGLAGVAPKVEAIGTALDAARLAGVLAVATTPRRAYCWQQHLAVWRQYALGPVSRSADGTGYRFGLECAGEAL